MGSIVAVVNVFLLFGLAVCLVVASLILIDVTEDRSLPHPDESGELKFLILVVGVAAYFGVFAVTIRKRGRLLFEAPGSVGMSRPTKIVYNLSLGIALFVVASLVWTLLTSFRFL